MILAYEHKADIGIELQLPGELSAQSLPLELCIASLSKISQQQKEIGNCQSCISCLEQFRMSLLSPEA